MYFLGLAFQGAAVDVSVQIRKNSADAEGGCCPTPSALKHQHVALSLPEYESLILGKS